MRRAICAAVILPATTLMFCQSVRADEGGPTSMELALLPRFCWAQNKVPNINGPEFYIRDCGPGANHYCDALLSLARARNPRRKDKPIAYLRSADWNLRYTETAIKDYPSCSIRDHVKGTRIEVNSLLRMYGVKALPPQQ